MSAARPPIDVRHLLKTYTLEQLNQTADDYFAQFDTPELVGRLAAKPFFSVEDAPTVLVSFGQVLEGLYLTPGLSVLDFGAGPCWIARCLAQLGMDVVAADVSPRALAIGRKGLELFPIQGEHTPPKFLLFDGRRLDLPDQSVDRICCFDAFHHVPNQAEALAELARVLKVGGIAGFSEPGPNHSLNERSQRAMREHTVIENDIVLEEIWPLAQKAGFSDIRVGYFTPRLTLLTTEEYNAHVNENVPIPGHHAQHLRALARERRMFFLYRYPKGVRSGKSGEGLRADVRVEMPSTTVPANTPFEVAVRARNTGDAAWMQASKPYGRVNVGVRKVVGGAKADHCRLTFPPTPRCAIFPGEEATARGAVKGLPPGRHRLAFDLVLEGVAWFEDKGGRPFELTVDAR